jgi:hypothetical protein
VEPYSRKTFPKGNKKARSKSFGLGIMISAITTS